MKKSIQVNVPYKMLLADLEFILEKDINPEIYFNGDALDTYHHHDLITLYSALRLNNLKITLHAPFMDLSPGGVDHKIRDVTIERFNQTLEVASVLHPQIIVFHPGYNKWLFDGNVRLWLENSIKVWRPLVAQAEKINTPIALENIFEDEPSSLIQLITSIQSPYFNFCFDTGHFHLFSKVSMNDWFDKLSNYIKIIHLHDNFKESDDHLPIGDGEIDFDLFFQLVKQYRLDSLFTIEPHQVEQLEKSLQAVRNYLLKIYG